MLASLVWPRLSTVVSPLGFDLGPVLRWVLDQPLGRFAPRLEVVCAEHPTPERGSPGLEVVVLPGCAAQAPHHELLELLLAGAQDLTVRLDGCSQQAASAQSFAPLSGLFAATGFTRFAVHTAAPSRARRRPVHTASAMPVSRRKLLTLGLSNATRQLDSHGLEGGDRFFPDASLSAPARLTAALRLLLGSSEPVTSQITDFSGSVSPAKKFTAAGCTACNVCVRACPSDALSLTHLGGSQLPATPQPGAQPPAVSTLAQTPASCDGCLECVSACPTDVLAVAGQWSWADTLLPTAQGQDKVFAITSLTTAQCQRCRGRFPTATGEALCQVCSYRRKNPFSSTKPPDFRLDPNAAR